jgi:hypothetical protein
MLPLCLTATLAVLAKHSKNFSLRDSLAIGVDRMQRSFEPMRRQVEVWRAQQVSTTTAKLVIYRASVEGELEAPRHLAPATSPGGPARPNRLESLHYRGSKGIEALEAHS